MDYILSKGCIPFQFLNKTVSLLYNLIEPQRNNENKTKLDKMGSKRSIHERELRKESLIAKTLPKIGMAYTFVLKFELDIENTAKTIEM